MSGSYLAPFFFVSSYFSDSSGCGEIDWYPKHCCDLLGVGCNGSPSLASSAFGFVERKYLCRFVVSSTHDVTKPAELTLADGTYKWWSIDSVEDHLAVYSIESGEAENCSIAVKTEGVDLRLQLCINDRILILRSSGMLLAFRIFSSCLNADHACPRLVLKSDHEDFIIEPRYLKSLTCFSSLFSSMTFSVVTQLKAMYSVFFSLIMRPTSAAFAKIQ